MTSSDARQFLHRKTVQCSWIVEKMKASSKTEGM